MKLSEEDQQLLRLFSATGGRIESGEYPQSIRNRAGRNPESAILEATD
jgi:hypothetical protein